MKNLKQKFEVIIRLTLALIITITSFGYSTVVLANSTEKGYIRNGENTVGSTTNAGDVELKKTVSKTNEEGIYNVTLTATGKEKVTTKSSTAPIYTVVVLDNSGSMDNCTLCWFETNKYDNAKAGARSFARTLLSNYSSANLALVTFSTGARVTRDFENKNFNNVSFPSPNGLTYLADGINKANELLASVKAKNSNAKLYMVILTDGYPEEDNITTAEAATKAKNAATTAKTTNGIEIFTIGYDTGKDTKLLLQQIATDNDHFTEADEKSIVEKFTDIAGSIEVKIPAATNTTVTDVIADGFTYVEGSATVNTVSVNGQTISFDIGTLTEEGTTVSFKIKIDKDIETGWHRTNNSASISYDESATPKTITDSAEVYWVQQKYDYTINYYQDSSIDGELLHSETKQTKKSVINASDISLNDYKPTVGYKDGEFVTSMPYTLTGNNDVINIVYKKKDNLSYIVEYYKDGNIKLSKDAENIYKNQLFGSKILSSDILVDKYLPTFGYKPGRILTSMPYTIIDGQNVIRVCYEKRDDIPYIVKYLEKDTEEYIGLDSETKEGTFEGTYTEQAKTAPKGYKLADSETKTITLDQLNKELKFYYEKRNDYSYKVNYLELGTNKVLSKQKIVNDVSYLSEHVENAISIKGYNLVNDGDDSSQKTIIIEDDNQEINFYYTIKDDLKYRVEYYFDGEIDSSKTDYFEGFTYGTVIRNYTDKLPRGYRFDKDTAPLTIDDEKENVIKVYYVENPEGDLMPPKTGINSTKYLSFAYLLSAVIITFAVRKKEN